VRRIAIVGAVAVIAAIGAVVAFGVLGPDPEKQSRADGCGRSRQLEFTRRSPGWVYVNDKDFPASGATPTTQWLSGVVSAYRNLPDASHPSGGDDPTTHDSFDLNFNVLPDPGYEQLMGGLAEADTGNFEGEGEEKDRIHLERESNAVPAWSWPEAGDRVQAMGSWVWDCGHWDPGGERTEIHPYRAIWDERAPSARSPYGESEGDLYVSTDATPAGQIAECAHKTKGDPVAYKACSFTQSNWLDVSGDYTLTLAAPPRPPGATHLAVRVVDRGSTVSPAWSTTTAGGKLTLRFHLDATPDMRIVVAKQVYLGWRPLAAATLPEHLRLTFTKLLTRRAMDPGCPDSKSECGSVQTLLGDQITKGPGELLVYTDVAGIWALWPRVRAALLDRPLYAPGAGVAAVRLPARVRFRRRHLERPGQADGAVPEDRRVRERLRRRRAGGDRRPLSRRAGGRRARRERQPSAAVDLPAGRRARVLPPLVGRDPDSRRGRQGRTAALVGDNVRTATEEDTMAGTRRTDLLGRLADMSEEAIQRLSDAPGADKLLGAMNALRDRTDELQKRVRGLENLEQRLSALERKVDKLGGTKSATTSKSTKATTTKSSGGSTAKKS
jgi:hypothetical protein